MRSQCGEPAFEESRTCAGYVSFCTDKADVGWGQAFRGIQSSVHVVLLLVDCQAVVFILTILTLESVEHSMLLLIESHESRKLLM